MLTDHEFITLSEKTQCPVHLFSVKVQWKVIPRSQLTGNCSKSWYESQGPKRVLKEDKENAMNGKQKDSVREETSVVAGTMRISVQSRHQTPLRPPNHQHKEVEVRRGKRTSEAGVHLGSSRDSRAKTA